MLVSQVFQGRSSMEQVNGELEAFHAKLEASPKAETPATPVGERPAQPPVQPQTRAYDILLACMDVKGTQ